MDCCRFINRRDQRGHCQHGSTSRPCQTSPTREQTCSTRAKEKREKTRGEKASGEKTQCEKTCEPQTRDSKTSATPSPLMQHNKQAACKYLQAACLFKNTHLAQAAKPYQNL